MNQDKHRKRNDIGDMFQNFNMKMPHFLSSQSSFENSVMTGGISGQSIPYLKKSENDVRAFFCEKQWNSKSKSEPKIHEDFGF